MIRRAVLIDLSVSWARASVGTGSVEQQVGLMEGPWLHCADLRCACAADLSTALTPGLGSRQTAYGSMGGVRSVLLLAWERKHALTHCASSR
jgi:hypothetical protein